MSNIEFNASNIGVDLNFNNIKIERKDSRWSSAMNFIKKVVVKSEVPQPENKIKI